MDLHIATTNQHKFSEISTLLALKSVQISLLDIPLIEPQSIDILEIADFKMQQALNIASDKNLTGWVLVDDTGLQIEAMAGLPGALVKFFLQKMSLSDLASLKLESRAQLKTALALCVIGLGDIKTLKAQFFTGEVVGTLHPPDTDAGFGWDSIFYPLGFNESYAKMGVVKKNQLSHRAKALKQAKNFLISQAW